MILYVMMEELDFLYRPPFVIWYYVPAGWRGAALLFWSPSDAVAVDVLLLAIPVDWRQFALRSLPLELVPWLENPPVTWPWSLPLTLFPVSLLMTLFNADTAIYPTLRPRCMIVGIVFAVPLCATSMAGWCLVFDPLAMTVRSSSAIVMAAFKKPFLLSSLSCLVNIFFCLRATLNW